MVCQENDCGRAAGAEPESSAGPTRGSLHKEGNKYHHQYHNQYHLEPKSNLFNHHDDLD